MISGAALVGAGVGLDRVLGGAGSGSDSASNAEQVATLDSKVAFHGARQAGIATPPQAHLSFASFDVTTESHAALRGVLRRWTAAAAAITAGRQYVPPERNQSLPPADPGESVGLAPSRLTLTFGFGPTLFERDGQDRFGLAGRRPSALRPLPRFSGEALEQASSGGDLCVQACAEDPQSTFHAIHLMAMLAAAEARMRWMHVGFRTRPAGDAATGRNLLGFKDGTRNIRTADAAALNDFVWVQGDDQPRWMRGGTYLVARRIEIVLSAWDSLTLPEQERAIGRYKLSGAPLGAHHEQDQINLAAVDRQGNSIIPIDAHVRIASPETNGALRILRRGYSFSRGATPGSVDRGGHQLDGGLFFIGFTRDLDRFAPLLRRVMSRDALNEFTLHTGSAVFAVPPGVRPGGFIGDQLFS
jgi:deferrochelatase/peroxidase EfeB